MSALMQESGQPIMRELTAEQAKTRRRQAEKALGRPLPSVPVTKFQVRHPAIRFAEAAVEVGDPRYLMLLA